MSPYKILLYPLMGEKATMLREAENKLTFVVDKNADKEDIKRAVEELYAVKVKKVNTMITIKGKKRAHIKLADEYNAEEVASQFGVL
ncbi:MAG: 50S ribosomal protein L23 [Candidatus Altiarchaeales archaeon WOR_SM1_86-2]|nr:MAG: 50S ribosomal protein L23 [Candidatus Altiarchaeales archaeon WOR_SM1_86-2]ODS41608.1 MAG: 50S ribosomal protein L23 [Candidatus Altiarchaeales archaeon WOR_SM1_79]